MTACPSAGEWVLDADLYQVDITLACGAFKAVHLLLEGHWHNPDKLWQCMALLARLVGNVSGCQNSQEKFRQVRADNPKVRDQVLALAGAQGVLMAAGFQKAGDVFSYPAAATEQMLKLTGLVASKLQQLVDRKGFSGQLPAGCAKPVDDEVAASGSSSVSARMTRWHNTPGFRYQQDIHCCSLCAHPINDGSERLFTGAHDAPRGEFRYECQQCADPAVNLVRIGA
ncbi:ZZ-type domain-containing protein [Haematococcus lacustris]|uniref:ZZ-type domain-containing protein n=1 Tax=Haematococcus lacustris TaxID=44745 RepID=A0A699ZFL9_HAELA|nr:ZZ-type domain-containing protein [Haematococcus lacustris]